MTEAKKVDYFTITDETNIDNICVLSDRNIHCPFYPNWIVSESTKPFYFSELESEKFQQFQSFFHDFFQNKIVHQPELQHKTSIVISPCGQQEKQETGADFKQEESSTHYMKAFFIWSGALQSNQDMKTFCEELMLLLNETQSELFLSQAQAKALLNSSNLDVLVVLSGEHVRSLDVYFHNKNRVNRVIALFTEGTFRVRYGSLNGFHFDHFSTLRENLLTSV
jgi:hypothetical protein